MPGYVRLGPKQITPPKYGQQIQTEEIDNSEPMAETERKTLEQVCGLFLYYARAVDPIMMHVLNILTTKQSKWTKNSQSNVTLPELL